MLGGYYWLGDQEPQLVVPGEPSEMLEIEYGQLGARQTPYSSSDSSFLMTEYYFTVYFCCLLVVFLSHIQKRSGLIPGPALSDIIPGRAQVCHLHMGCQGSNLSKLQDKHSTHY